MPASCFILKKNPASYFWEIFFEGFVFLGDVAAEESTVAVPTKDAQISVGLSRRRWIIWDAPSHARPVLQICRYTYTTIFLAPHPTATAFPKTLRTAPPPALSPKPYAPRRPSTRRDGCRRLGVRGARSPRGGRDTGSSLRLSSSSSRDG